MLNLNYYFKRRKEFSANLEIFYFNLTFIAGLFQTVSISGDTVHKPWRRCSQAWTSGDRSGNCDYFLRIITKVCKNTV